MGFKINILGICLFYISFKLAAQLVAPLIKFCLVSTERSLITNEAKLGTCLVRVPPSPKVPKIY